MIDDIEDRKRPGMSSTRAVGRRPQRYSSRHNIHHWASDVASKHDTAQWSTRTAWHSWPLDFTYLIQWPGDEDDILAHWQTACWTMNPPLVPLHARWEVSCSNMFINVPCIVNLPLLQSPSSTMSMCICEETMPVSCPKQHFSLRFCRTPTISFSTHSSIFAFSFRLRSLLDIPQIFLNSDISKTLSFRFSSSFMLKSQNYAG